MRKTLRIFAAILLTMAMLSSLVACTSPQNQKTEDAEDTVTVYLRTEAIRCRKNEEIPEYWKFGYDSRGNLLSVSGRNSDNKEFYHAENEYDSKSNVILSTFNYDSNVEKFAFRHEYEYTNSDSKKTTYTDGVLHSVEQYDRHGKITSSIDYRNEGSEIWRRSNYEYEYDSNGNVILMVRYDNGTETRTEKYEYDQSGRKTLYVLCEDGVETICEEYEYEFEYDNSGNVIQESCYCNGEVSYRYEYDSNGVKKLDIHYSNGNELERIEYDENGCPTQHTYYLSSSTTVTTFRYKKLTLSRQQAEKVAKQEFFNIAFFIDLPLVIISE